LIPKLAVTPLQFLPSLVRAALIPAKIAGHRALTRVVVGQQRTQSKKVKIAYVTPMDPWFATHAQHALAGS
jgi:hypothetical protein